MINKFKIIYSNNWIYKKLKKIGIKKVNSISYKIKNTHKIEKFKLIWTFMSLVDLNPHS